MPRTHAQRLASRDGYFPPESVVRRLGNSPAIPLLGGGAAVLLQVAHPLVGAGVADHSGFDRDLWRRLIQTMRALYLVVYGTKAEAERAAAAVAAVHAHVHGVLPERRGRFPAGTRYSATEPDLMLWVHATLVECSLRTQNELLGRLTPDEEERYYAEMALMARIFGVPAATIPPTLRDFRGYWADTVAGDTLAVTEPARWVASVLLHPRLPPPLRLLVPAHRLATAFLLPPRLRAEYGLASDRRRAAALRVAARGLKTTATPLLAAASRIAPPPNALAA